VPSGDDVYPRPWPDGRHVVVTPQSTGGAATTIVDARDGSKTPIAAGPVGYPTWSRDGRTLAFVDGSRARFVDVRGRPVEAFVPPPLTAWSPDGQRLAYTRTSGDGRAGTLKTVLIVAPIQNLRGGRTVYVEPNPYGESPDGRWSADGKTLYFYREGKGLALSVSTGAVKSTSREFRGLIRSPDGDKAIFSAVGPWGVEDVFTVNADGSGKRRLTTSRPPELGVPQEGSTPAGWSPDSEWIVYGRKWGLAIMRHDGSEKTLICRTPVGVIPGAAAWSYGDASAVP
jgi:Tol biopolymer transport system component